MALTAAIIVLVDQLSKTWAVRRLTDRAPIELVGSLRLNLTFNEGTAFSLGQGRNLGPVIAVLALVVVVVLVTSGHTTRSRVGAFAVGLVAGGAVGNLADRAFRRGGGFLGGRVVDFVDLQWWPTFNVADAAIVVGALCLLAAGLRNPAGAGP